MNLNRIIIILLLGTYTSAICQEELVNIKNFDNNIIIEMRYATENNFMNEKVYNCEICLLQPEVAEALIKANIYFNKLGYRIKIYDCYRPFDIQKKMWKLMPRATYIANPDNGGSIHNKGAAIDLTLEKLDGTSLNMGTDYDYFGKKAHIDYFNLSEDILKNRTLLFNGMRKYGFQTIRTEWWHFSFKKNISYPTLNIPFPCEN